MVEIIDIEQGTNEWLTLRNKYIKTASRTPIVLGVSPFSNKEKLADEIKFNIKPFYSNAMREGNKLEEMVRSFAEGYFSQSFTPRVGIRAGFLASLDGISDDGNMIIEIKVSDKTYEDVKNGIIPEHYLWQIKHQLYVFDSATQARLVAYSPIELEYAISEPITPPTSVEVRIMQEAWDEFEQFLQTYEPKQKRVITDEAQVTLANRYYELALRIKELQEQQSTLKQELQTLASDEKTYVSNVLIYKTKPRTTYDYKSLIKDLQVDKQTLEKYAKVGKESVVIKAI